MFQQGKRKITKTRKNQIKRKRKQTNKQTNKKKRKRKSKQAVKKAVCLKKKSMLTNKN